MADDTDDSFTMGDVVQIQSGGPPMTVQSLDSDGTIVCAYFNYLNRLVTVRLSRAMLKRAEPLSRPWDAPAQ